MTAWTLEKPVNQKNNPNIVLAVLCTGIFLAAVDQTVVVTVLPQIVSDLQNGFSSAGVERAGWIVTAYLTGYTIMLPLMGRVADLHGHRRTYNLAMAIFAAGSLMCALTPNLFFLVGFRAIQAVGGGAVLPIALAVVGDRFPSGKRALALGIIGAAAEAGGVLGPLYGSLIGQYLGWRAIFYLNIPLVLLIIWLMRRYVAESGRRGSRVDWRSGALLAAALGLATAGVSGAREAGWLVFGGPLLALSIGFLAGFIFSVKRAEHPLIDFSMFRSRSFSAANAAHFLLGVALITALAQVPVFAYSAGWPETADVSPLRGGLLLIRLTLLIPVGAVLGGLLSARVSGRLAAVAGFCLSAFGLWRLSMWQTTVGDLRQTFDLMTSGIGFGLVIAPISLAAIEALRRDRLASGASVLTASRITGMAVGLAALNSWGITDFESTMSRFPAPLPQIGESFSTYLNQISAWEHRNIITILGVFRDFFLIAAAACLLAVIPAILLFSGKRRPAGSNEDGFD